jgi:hypothetical protein
VVPCGEKNVQVESHGRHANPSRSPLSIQTVLCLSFMQSWFCLLDPAMEEAHFYAPMYRDFALLPEDPVRLPV